MYSAKLKYKASFSQWWGGLALLVLVLLVVIFLYPERNPSILKRTTIKVGTLPPGTPVLFLTIDTLRVDHMGRSGYHRNTTPFLDRLAADGIYFSRCFAQSSWTLPSILSLFSSLSPPVFGIRDGVDLVPRGKWQKSTGDSAMNVEVFAEGHVTLPEVLRDNGYYTAGISTNGHLIERQGFNQGFVSFNEVDCMWGTAECAIAQALQVIDSAPMNHFFLWVHIFDPHFNKSGKPPVYTPPPGYEELFSLSPWASTVDEVIANYDRKIRYADDQLNLLFTALEKRGILNKYLVVIAVDHGEEFMEKGRWGHSKALTNTLIHVPLIFRLPNKLLSDLVVSDVVSNIDVMPTILDLLGLPLPSSAEGISLKDVWEGKDLPSRLVYSETQRFGRNMRCLIDSERDRKFVMDLKTGRREFYSLSADFMERKNLTGQFVEHEVEMTNSLSVVISEMKQRAIVEILEQKIPEQEREYLESLGYIDG